MQGAFWGLYLYERLSGKKKNWHTLIYISFISIAAEKEADNVITEFLRTSEEERQTQAELLDREKEDEMILLSQSHSEQFNLRAKETLRKLTTKKELNGYLLLLVILFLICLQLLWRSC